jgi:hypothetical protein
MLRPALAVHLGTGGGRGTQSDSDPDPDTLCAVLPVPCPLQCGATPPRIGCHAHVADQCPRRPVPCAECGDPIEMWDLEDHLQWTHGGDAAERASMTARWGWALAEFSPETAPTAPVSARHATQHAPAATRHAPGAATRYPAGTGAGLRIVRAPPAPAAGYRDARAPRAAWPRPDDIVLAVDGSRTTSLTALGVIMQCIGAADAEDVEDETAITLARHRRNGGGTVTVRVTGIGARR